MGLDVGGESIPYVAVWREHTRADAFEQIAALVDRLARRLEDTLQPLDDPAGEAAGEEMREAA